MICILDEKIKFEEESNSTISLDCNKLMQSKKNMNEQIQVFMLSLKNFLFK